MTELAIYAGLAFLLLAVLLWLVLKQPESRRLPQAAPRLAVEELFPLHCRYFPQVRQALSPADREYLRERASPRIRRQAHVERRRVTRQFLAGLSEDFSRLDRLGRAVAALSPEVSRKREAERLWLGVRFRVLYRVAQLQLLAGSVSIPQLTQLADLIGSLASQTEARMAALEEASMTRLRSNLSF